MDSHGNMDLGILLSLLVSLCLAM